jgi:hypothetical protein
MTAGDVLAIQYKRERATGNLVATVHDHAVVLRANRSGLDFNFNQIISYTAIVDGKPIRTGTLKDAKLVAGLELLDIVD